LKVKDIKQNVFWCSENNPEFRFIELNIVPKAIAPGLQYWRGIREALAAKGIEVITATVPPSGSIEARAQKLSEDIHNKAKGKSVNIIA
jgi:triacylglycerol lipase